MAPYWIHCNLCAALLANQKTSLYLLSCKHVLCKECMQQTDRGKKCPICKAAIKFIDFRKLPEEQKRLFRPNDFKELFKKPLETVKFQNAQQNNLAKLVEANIAKVKKAAQYHAEMKERIKKKEAAVKRLIAKRRAMQERLKEIYMNKKKKASQKYRDPEPSFDTNTSTSSKISSKASTTSLFSNARHRPAAPKVTPLALYSTSFFNPPSNSGRSSGGGSIFGENQQQRRPLTERSQMSRSPFFA